MDQEQVRCKYIQQKMSLRERRKSLKSRRIWKNQFDIIATGISEQTDFRQWEAGVAQFYK